MKANTARLLRALFWVYVAGTFVHIAYVVNREPFAFDAWNVAVDTDAKPATLGRFFSFWHQQYTTSNPRIGQPLTYLAYKLAGVAEIGTPLAFFAIVVAGFVLGIITDRQAVQVVEDLHTQGPQHVLPRPSHREESRTGQQRARHVQDEHQGHETP